MRVKIFCAFSFLDCCRFHMTVRSTIKSSLFVFCCLFAVAATAADAIHGKVINQTTHQASVGDDVVLLRMGEGMQEESRVRTDAQGQFSMHLGHPDAQYVIRAMHQGVNYDLSLAGASELQLEVFDAAAKIKGLSGTLGMAQIEPDGAALKVTEMYSISNASAPPITQIGQHNFEVHLPDGATLDSLAAKRAQGIWVNLTAVPAPGKQGRYSVDFPLRPGDTLFKFSYHLPASGVATLHLKPAYPVQSFAVMHPPAMKFKSLQPRAFTSPGLVKGMQVEQAVNKVTGEVPAFEVSGIGLTAAKAALPTDEVSPAASVPVATSPAAPPPADSENETEQRSKREAWMIGSLTLLLVVGGVFALWRRGQRQVSGRSNADNVQTLKDELFDLETERFRGSISAEQYDSAKDALILSMQRAMNREKA
jgi:hypothetical protein